MRIDYHNMPSGVSKTNFIIRYIFNIIRTWYLFHLRYPWVKYNGFVRVMKGTTFAHKKIELGHNVQFGQYCHIDTNVVIGNNVLVAGRVCFMDRYGHRFNEVGLTIWNSKAKNGDDVVIGDDVWICDGAFILSGCKIGNGSIVTARSVLTHDIPECEIWGGIPAKKIKDRFLNEEEKKKHLNYLKQLRDEYSSYSKR